MAEIGKWNGHSFVVKPTLIQSFSDLSIKGSSETEEKTGNGEKYVSRKNGKPFEVGLTVELNAYLGSDVRKEAMTLAEEAEKGESSYFYIAGKKLLPCKLMLVEASVEEIAMNPKGIWVSCKVQLKMKQCSKGDNTPALIAASGGGGKQTYLQKFAASTMGKAVGDMAKTKISSWLGNGNAAGTSGSGGTGSSFLQSLNTVQNATRTGRENTSPSTVKKPVQKP